MTGFVAARDLMPILAVGDLVELACDVHRPRRVRVITSLPPNGDVWARTIPTPGCDCDVCGYVTSSTGSAYGTGLLVRRAAPDVQASLW